MEWIVLNDWRGRLGGNLVKLSAAEVIDDRLLRLEELRANGVALELFDAARHTRALAAFRSAYRAGGGDLGALLQSLGLSSSGASTTSGGQLDIYVAEATPGASDANPGTIAQPLATFAAAVNRVPLIIEEGFPAVIHMGAHSGSGYTWATVSERILRDNLYVIGDGAGQGTDDGFTELLAPEAAVAGSSVSTVVSTSVLVANAFRSKTIEILSGAAAGDRRTIRDNTTSNLTPVTTFSAAVGVGDSFRIVEPNVVFDLPGSEVLLARAVGSSGTDRLTADASPVRGVALINFALDATGLSQLELQSATVVFVGIETLNDGIALEGSRESRFMLGTDGGALVSFASLFEAGAGTRSWVGWGFAAAAAGAFNGLTVRNTRVFGFYVGSALFNITADVRILGGAVTLDGINTSANNGGSAFTCFAADSLPILVGDAATPSSIFAVTAEGAGAEAELLGVIINAAVDAVTARQEARITLDQTPTANSITTTARGVFASLGGVVIFKDGVPSVAAAGNDVEVNDPGGANPSALIAAFAASGDNLLPAIDLDGSKVQRV